MADPAPASEFPVERINAAYRQTRLIVLSIAATLPVYALVAELLLRSEPAITPMSSTSTLRITFFALAAVCLWTVGAAAYIIRSTPSAAVIHLEW